MKYDEYIKSVFNSCVAIDDNNEIAYLLSDWRKILYDNNLRIENSYNDKYEMNMEILKLIILLKIDAYNKMNNRILKLANFISALLVGLKDVNVTLNKKE